MKRSAGFALLALVMAAGDRAGWQTEIRNRGVTQNEYSRIGH